MVSWILSKVHLAVECKCVANLRMQITVINYTQCAKIKIVSSVELLQMNKNFNLSDFTDVVQKLLKEGDKLQCPIVPLPVINHSSWNIRRSLSRHWIYYIDSIQMKNRQYLRQDLNMTLSFFFGLDIMPT